MNIRFPIFMALLGFLVAPIAMASGVSVVILGDDSRIPLLQAFATDWHTAPVQTGSVIQLSDQLHKIKLIVPSKEATVFEMANASMNADYAIIVMDATAGPAAIIREHTILTRQTGVPALGLFVTNVKRLAQEKGAGELLAAEEREALEIFKIYALKGENAVIFSDYATPAAASGSAVIGIAPVTQWFRANVTPRKATPTTSAPAAEYECSIYLLTIQESRWTKSIPPGGDLRIWVDGQVSSGKAKTTAPIQPGDNATLSVSLNIPAKTQKGSRFFLEREGHLIGVGTVAKIDR
jgi:translation elongation factor EF-Tu-like GTPase